jgi:nitrogenase molybdenum-iron protein alpha/beta subunit
MNIPFGAQHDRLEALSVNPIKAAPGLGAGYAAQGFRKTMPFYHSAPGCNFLSKVILTQHFMEPIAAAGSDIKETALIFGGTHELQNTIEKFCEKSNPEIVFILSSSIPEIRGEEYLPCLKYLEAKFLTTKFIVVQTPDFKGGFSEGFADLVYAAIINLAEVGEKIKNQINFLPAPYMTAGDIDEFVEIAESFGLQTIVIPDLSSGPDGSKEKFASMSIQGTNLEQLKLAGRSAATITVGESMKPVGDFLENNHDVKRVHFDSITGLLCSDELIRHFMFLSGKTEVPSKIKKERARFKDIMIDTHLLLNNKNIALALEADHIMAYKSLFAEIGVNSEIIAGTLYDIEEHLASGATVDALIGGAHGKELAIKYNVPLIRAGFPVTDRYGMNYNISIGYKGGIYLIRELANILSENREKK